MVTISKAKTRSHFKEKQFSLRLKTFVLVQLIIFGVTFLLLISKHQKAFPVDEADGVRKYEATPYLGNSRSLSRKHSFSKSARLKPSLVRLLDYNDVVPINADKIYRPMSKRDKPPADYFKRRRSILSQDGTSIVNSTAPISEEEECQSIYSWENDSYPSCNTMHEVGWISSIGKDTGSVQSQLINNGLWRDVWKLTELGSHNVALKTLRYEQEFKKFVYNSQRIDAILMEKLTASENVASIYGFCGFSGLFDFSDGGDLEQYAKFNKEEKFHIAIDITRGLSDFHHHINDNDTNEDSKPLPFEVGIVHSDIAVRQFLKIDGSFKLNDFNIAKFIRWNPTTKEKCLPTIGKPGHGDRNRAPEEYMTHENEIDEKVDVYSLGNIFYKFLMNERKYDSSNLSHQEVRELIKSGDRPPIPDNLENSSNPFDIALLHAMDMCLKLEPSQRASSKEIYEYLSDQKKKMALLKK